MSNDSTQRFLFDHTDIRGELVHLDESYQEGVTKHNYPEPVANLLGEFLAASVLLSTSIKFEGKLILQAQSEGEVSMVMAECSHEQVVRGVARFTSPPTSNNFKALLHKGTLAITIEPEKGQRYQGLVPLDGESLAGCLEDYFAQSEQLATRFFFATGEDKVSGMMLQQLPPQKTEVPETREEQWNHVTHLAHTLTNEELLTLDAETILYRLFHDDDVRLFDSRPVEYRCSCSRERTGAALLTLKRTELEDILTEQGSITMNCQFCNQEYSYSREDAEELVVNSDPKN